MITPKYLEKGDKVAIVAPARSISFDEVHPTIRLMQRWGLEVVLGTNIFRRYNQFSGNDDARKADLQQMLDDDSIRAIICARGGYGTVRIIDRIDFSRFCRNPKWIVGYSDITVLHAHIQRHFQTETLHATMPINIKSDTVPDESTESMRKALFGQKISYTLPTSSLARKGDVAGVLTGGNLSILYSLLGSVSESDTTDKILFLEDVEEYLYHIDRMMMALKRSGKLDKLKGLIVGGMDRMNDNAVPYGKSACEIISEVTGEYQFPVCFGFPAGHGDKNLALIIGRKIKLSVGHQVNLEF